MICRERSISGSITREFNSINFGLPNKSFEDKAACCYLVNGGGLEDKNKLILRVGLRSYGGFYCIDDFSASAKRF